MIQPLLDDILAETYTRADALNRLHILKDQAILRLFGRGGNGGNTQQAGLTPPTGQQIALPTSITCDNVYKIFDALEAEIKNIKTLTVFLPFEPSGQIIVALGQYLRQLFGKNFLAEVKYDPTLLAGTALVWNGIYRDCSLRKKIRDNREKITNMLKEEIHNKLKV